MLKLSDNALRWLVKPLVFTLSLLPFGWLVYAAINDELGANPVESITHQTGDWGLYFLLITLSITPLRQLSGAGWLLRLRRMLGLYAFFYASLHLTTYIWLDQFFNWSAVLEDIGKRPYITVGFLAWLILLALAITSVKRIMKRMGRNWKRLHRLVYVAATLAVLHYLWLVKADYLQPMIFGAILIGLLLLRTDLVKIKRPASG
ncbi:MAG: protein-methionine-sulfoxide reductase heme-binding subunit MsrQ [Chromatiales bacterium]|jgi:sulfoxide reductase heme-binding subunit YedZ